MASSPHPATSEGELPSSVPQVTVQHDFLAVIDDVRAGTVESEEFWVSTYVHEKPSVHGKVKVSKRNPSEEAASSINLEGHHGVLWFSSGMVRTGIFRQLRSPNLPVEIIGV